MKENTVGPRDIDMEKHEVVVNTKEEVEDIDVKEESVDQRENDLETYVAKDIKVKANVDDKLEVYDFEDDIEMKEKDAFSDPESGPNSEIDPLSLSPTIPMTNDRCLQDRVVLPFSPTKNADLLSDVSTSETESDEMDFSEESDSKAEISENDANNDEDEVASRGTWPRSVKRRRASGSVRQASSSRERLHQDDTAWTKEATLPNILPFTAMPGLLCNVPFNPLQFFQLFFTRTLLHYIATQTNTYANYKKPGVHVFSMQDIANFLGVRMYMGFVRMPSEYDYWEKSIFGSATVQNIMSHKHYKNISRYIHFFDRRNVPNNTDRIMHIRPIVHYFQQKCKTLYTPQVNLSLHEGLISLEGRLPMKPNKCAIKIYYLCEAVSGYVCDLSIYQGVSSTIRDTVFSLLQRHLNLGYRVFMDNNYNSVALSEELYDNGTHVCGMLHLPCGAPSVLQNLAKTKIPRNQLNFRRKGDVFVICWQDTRLVSMITTMHNAETEPHVHSRRVKKQGQFTHKEVHLDRPVAIRDYTQYMQGVDRFDHKVKYYNIDRRPIKWTNKAFFYFLELMVVNAHILYQKYSTDEKKLSLKQFREVIGIHFMEYDEQEWPVANDRALLPPFYGSSHAEEPNTPSLPTPFHLPPDPPLAVPTESENEEEDKQKAKNYKYPDSKYRLMFRGKDGLIHGLTSWGKRRRCRVCSRKKIRKDTAFACRACGGVALCIAGTCYLDYHQKQHYWLGSSDASTN